MKNGRDIAWCVAVGIVLASVACSSAKPPTSSTPSQKIAAASPAIDRETSPVASTDPATAAAEEPADAELVAPEPAVPDAVPSTTCSGAALDLDALLATTACDVDGDAALAPPRERLHLSIEPAELRVKRGRRAEAQVVMKNVGADPLVLDLPMGCGKDVAFEAGLYRSGERADRIEVCGTGRGCRRRTMRVQMDPGGTLSTRIAFAATVERQDDDCDFARPKPIAPGAYELRVSTPLNDRGDCSNCVESRDAVGKVRVH